MIKTTKSFLLAGTLAFATVGPALAQCLVVDAAEAALERELELIEALAVDPANSFRGPDSCVNMDLLTSLDLSILIPDIAGMITTGAIDALTGIIQDAQTQVCRQINDAIEGTVGTATSTVANFNSGLTDELNSVLTNGWGDLGIN